MNTVCLHVQFKNIKRSVLATERIEPFPFAVARHRGIIIPGHNQGHPTTIFGKYLFGRRFEI